MIQPNARLSPEEAHLEIRRRHPDPFLNSDYTIFSDGSGCEDPYSGGAAFVTARKPPTFIGWTSRACYATQVYNNVERIEFEAFLAGLQFILDRTGCHSGIMLDRMRAKPPSVAWITDRESLALSLWRPEGKDTFYARKASPDLWCRFAYYEQYFRVIPLFFKRGTVAMHTEADRMSDQMRSLIKEWVAIQLQNEAPPYIPPLP